MDARLKYLSFLLALSGVSACHRNAKEVLQLVNDQNDGWTAFTVSVFDDGTYKKEGFGDSDVGACSMRNDTVYFNTGRLKGKAMVFTRDSSGGVNKPGLISQENRTGMRVRFDSLFCTGKVCRP